MYRKYFWKVICLLYILYTRNESLIFILSYPLEKFYDLFIL